ncbi:MAG: LysM peptidoglycan-binding domain-containing protein, partial [Candidatus Acidiferrum sp.]
PEDRAEVESKKLECAQKNNCSPAPSENPPAGLDANSRTPANSQTPDTSLGEVARRYRKQKELQALKPKQTEPFHLPFSTPALASPVQPERPAIRSFAPLVVRPRISSHVVGPKISSHVVRRDPFSAVGVRPSDYVGSPRNVPSPIRAGARSVVHEDIRPTVSSNRNPLVRPVVRDNVRSEVRREVRPEIRHGVNPELGSRFFTNLRPANPSHVRRSVPAKPRISRRLAAPSLFLGPAKPTVLAKPAQPAAPRESVVPLEPVAPSETVLPHPAQRSLPPTALGVPTTISVRRGDSLWKLAQQILGHGDRWPELLAANRWIANPSQIQIGARLILPAGVATSLATRPARPNAVISGTASHSLSTITVHSGDTLWSLAKATLGRSADWPCLAAANPSLGDPNLIYPGQKLLLPSACGSDLSSSGHLGPIR